MSSFTCITCRVAFNNGEIQREHYKTDWHRYNLKRKVAEFPPVTSEEFQRRVLAQREKEDGQVQTSEQYCTVCRKGFSNVKSYETHLNSNRHKGRAFENKTNEPNEPKKEDVSEESDMEVEEVDSDEWEEDTENPIENNDCLFCTNHSRSLDKNLKHMTVEHSFFIPDLEYCVDLKGLLMYLGEKVSIGFMCLWCNDRGKTFHSAEAAQQHMVDKGHCKMLHEGIALAEYADYYDYSSSYPDAGEDVDQEEEVSADVLDDSDFQLVLPSGITVGHRSLMRYYKQNLNFERAVVPRNSRKLHKVLAHYRALGWTETQQEIAARKARDIHYMRRVQAKYNEKLGIKANKLQKHFRPQVNF